MKLIISVGGAASALVAVGALAYAKGKADGIRESRPVEEQIAEAKERLLRLMAEKEWKESSSFEIREVKNPRY